MDVSPPWWTHQPGTGKEDRGHATLASSLQKPQAEDMDALGLALGWLGGRLSPDVSPEGGSPCPNMEDVSRKGPAVMCLRTI